MLELQNQTSNDDCRSASDEDRESGGSAEDCNVTGISYPYSIGDLQILSLGNFLLVYSASIIQQVEKSFLV